MANIGDIFEFKLGGVIGSDSFLQVWHMRAQTKVGNPFVNGIDAAAFATAKAMAFELLIEDYQPWTTGAVQWQSLEVRNLFVPSELAAGGFSPVYSGTGAGQILPNFVSPTIVSQRKIYGMHGGRKSFPPPIEAAVTANVLEGGIIASLATMVGKWNTLTYSLIDGAGNGMDMKPVIIKRVREGAGTAADPYTYRLPENIGELTYYVADNWQASGSVGTQNTRKLGRGS